MTSKDIATNEIEEWKERNSCYIAYFNDKIIRALIDICIIVMRSLPGKEKTIHKFIGALAVYPISKILNDERYVAFVNRHLKWVIDVAVNYLTSENYFDRDYKREIEKVLTGDEYIEIRAKHIDVPLSLKAVMQYLNKLEELPLSSSDIGKINREFTDPINKEERQKDRSIEYLSDPPIVITQVYPPLTVSQVDPPLTHTQVDPKLSLSQVALIYIYMRKSIERGQNANEIALEYGCKSGDSLYNKYCHYSKPANRINADTDKKAENKINLIKSVLDHLTPKGRQMAQTEMNTLISKTPSKEE